MGGLRDLDFVVKCPYPRQLGLDQLSTILVPSYLDWINAGCDDYILNAYIVKTIDQPFELTGKYIIRLSQTAAFPTFAA